MSTNTPSLPEGGSSTSGEGGSIVPVSKSIPHQRRQQREIVKILIVDDEPKNLTVLETVLDDPSYQLVRASSADEALLALVADEFALLILDIRMPGMSGFELAQMIKERKKTAGIPIIFLTAYYNEDQHVLEGYGTGAVDYLHKPVNPVFLRSKVAVFVELHQRQREIGLANRALLAEVAERQRAQQELLELNRTLEHRVYERTELLRRSETHFRDTFENAPVGIADVGSDGRWLRVNRALCRITGYSSEELTAMSLTGVSHRDDLDSGLAGVKRVLAGEIGSYEGEGRFIRKDGSQIWVNLSISLLLDDSGRPLHFIAAVEDISAKRDALDELNRQKRFIERITEVMPTVLYVYDLAEGREIWFNRTVATVVGYGADEIQKLVNPVARALMHPDDLPRFEQHMRNVATQSDGEIAVFEYRVRHKDDPWRWFHRRDSVFARDAEGAVQQIIGTTIEITERKRAEEDLRRANQDLEQFAFSASHDLQEPLRNIAVFGQLLKKRYGNKIDDEADEFLGYMIEGAQRMGLLVSDLLAYTETASLEREAVTFTDAAKVLEQVVEAFQSVLTAAHGTITCDPLPSVAIKETHLQQLLQNLIANALKYRKDNEPPRVHVSAARQDGYWRFSVQDNGIGIAPEYYRTVFGIFKRLHPKGGKYSGTGMGLAICEKIVQSYGGTIWLESEIGQGSVFYFTIPEAGEIQ